MSSPTSSMGRTHHSPSEHTEPTNYSPEFLRSFKSLSLSSDYSQSNRAHVYEQLSDEKNDAVNTFVQAVIRSGRPNPFDGKSPALNNQFFGLTSKNELSTCFVYVSGQQEISDYYNTGTLSFALKRDSFVAIHSRSKGKEIFLYYKDSRDAQAVVELLHRYNDGTPATPVVITKAVCITIGEYCHSTRDLLKTVHPNDLGRTFTTGFDGQILFRVETQAMDINERVQMYAEAKIKQLIAPFADIASMKAVTVEGPQTAINFHVQLFEHFKADHIVDFFRDFRDGWVCDAMRIFCDYLTPRTVRMPSGPAGSVPDSGNDGILSIRGRFFEEPDRPIHTELIREDRNARDSLQTAPLFGVIGQKRSSPITATTPPTSYELGGSTRYPLEPVSVAARFPLESISGNLPPRRENKNFVDLTRIADGLDVRTTVMLRNIPNRISQPVLKQCLDAHVHGRYDFMYLRIDFTNNCNVGYAFINFLTAEDVAKFVQSVGGKKWVCSDKIAEVSYATMQGRETLIQKFRNSSVMNEAPGSRPKLFFAGDHPMAGHEMEFPKPDNLFKLQRSNQNAAHIGLFSPGRGGGHPGMERRRRGQYDRGTSFAEVEEILAENDYLRTLAGIRRGRGGMSLHPSYY